MSTADLIAVARGDRPADLVLSHARLVNVLSGEIHSTGIAIAQGRIAGLGDHYEGLERLDLAGRYVIPGLIDAHLHIESAMVTPGEFARAVVPRGVTTVVTDPHEIANVCGLDGVLFMLADAANTPLEIFVNAPSCVPATGLATSGARLEASDLATLLSHPRVLGLAEVMSYPDVVAGDRGILDKLEAFRGRVLDGHCPGLAGRALAAYVAAGISSDHESTQAEEARLKLRAGLTIFVREATAARNLDALLDLVTPTTERRFCFCTDDRQPSDLLAEGSVDSMLRRALGRGLDPVVAVRLASLNAAEHYGLDDRGAVAPGRRADLCVVESLDRFEISQVFIAGRRVAQDNRALFDADTADPGPVTGTVRATADRLAFGVPADGRRLRVIGLVPDQLLTEALEAEPGLESGLAVADPSRDLLKIAVVERHTGSMRTAVGFVRGLGLRRGALAGTVLHDHHNLVVVGADDASMQTAAGAVIGAQGGLAAALDDEVLEVLPLPLGGLMSDRPVEEVQAIMDRLLAAARGLGSELHDPFMAMGFLGLEVIPALKLTDRGLVDVEDGALVPLFLEP